MSSTASVAQSSILVSLWKLSILLIVIDCSMTQSIPAKPSGALLSPMTHNQWTLQIDTRYRKHSNRPHSCEASVTRNLNLDIRAASTDEASAEDCSIMLLIPPATGLVCPLFDLRSLLQPHQDIRSRHNPDLTPCTSQLAVDATVSALLSLPPSSSSSSNPSFSHLCH